MYYKQILRVGDRVIGPKSQIRWIQHHAIYLGLIKGQHTFIENKQGYGVRLISAAEFFKDMFEITRIKPFRSRASYTRFDLVRYALSKVGRPYDLLGYNCESFSNDVQHHKPESRQAQTGAAIGISILLLAMVGLVGGSSRR